ncbi:hypothetical protein PAHAL_3G029200 [Panicum hallii]|uniref:Uncharacterized protein n=1 Tax=Panicum hallii TaxID=206008 RepID=A0A2T8KGV6_9POAL|nr:hypothetical protein PAHAL_3G029200 [Panicum hallii]
MAAGPDLSPVAAEVARRVAAAASAEEQQERQGPARGRGGGRSGSPRRGAACARRGSGSTQRARCCCRRHSCGGGRIGTRQERKLPAVARLDGRGWPDLGTAAQRLLWRQARPILAKAAELLWWTAV